jgi:hypothetical protein
MMTMPATKTKTTNSLPRMKGDTGYGLGFFCGCLVGAIGTYMAFTPEGKKLKLSIIKEYRNNQQLLTLQTLRPETGENHESKTLHSIKKIIAGLRSKITSFTPEKPGSKTASTESRPKKKHYFTKK